MSLNNVAQSLHLLISRSWSCAQLTRSLCRWTKLQQYAETVLGAGLGVVAVTTKARSGVNLCAGGVNSCTDGVNSWGWETARVRATAR
eukprot:6026470-Pyramimonas_sp.AAC.1